MNIATDLGSYVEVDGRPAVRFERIYPHPVERVWAAITDPTDLAHWFPSPDTTIEPNVGGRIEFHGDPRVEGTSGTVLEWDPPTRLAYSWGPDELRFELSREGESSCRLVLLNVLAENNTAARNASGWLVCLGELEKTLAGRPGDGPHGNDLVAPWPDVYEAHVAAGLPSGAPIPR
ncbi:MAG TPA: SRPBCC family protein [Jatrophihabitantaceae bacterium]|nr:SRPBCC family protein [Jatrophihabitantaceae bacterium]